MRIPSTITMALVVLLLASVSLADEIVLKGGEVGEAEVTATTFDSVTLKYNLEDGPTATMTLRAAQLDPHCFYTVRNKHMEDTVENHMALAKFCVSNELFFRAQIQVNKAKAIDPEKVEEILDDAQVRERIAQKLLTYIDKEMEIGNLDEAEKWISVLLTRFPDTKAAESARQDLDQVDEARAAQKAKEAAERQARIEAEKDEAEKQAARQRAAQLAPIYQRINLGEKMYSASLRMNNNSQAKKGLEQAGMEFVSAIKDIKALRKKIGDDRELDQLEAVAQADAIKAYIGAGNVDLTRGSYNEANKWARRALAVDSDSTAAKDFQNRVTTAAAMSSGDIWGRRDRR